MLAQLLRTRSCIIGATVLLIVALIVLFRVATVLTFLRRVTHSGIGYW